MNTALALPLRNRARFCLMALVCAAQLPQSPASAQSGMAPATSYTDFSRMLVSGNPLLLNNPNLNNPNQPPAPGSNFSTIDQRGATDSASADVAGFGNMTVQVQNGIGNSSILSVVGNQNTIGTFQRGNNDSASISVIGQNNKITDVQIGSNLSFSLQQVGNGANVTVQQVRR
jgi:hypothetical protein